MKEIILIFLAGFIMSGCTWNSGRDGEYVGYLSDTWTKGIVWENYRISIKPELESTEVWHTCLPLDRTDVLDKAKDLKNKKARVIMTYHVTQGIGFGKCVGSVVDDINELAVKE